MQAFTLLAALIAVSFAWPATAAPFSLVASASDVSQTLSFGRFDPSLGVLSGFRANLVPAPPSPSPYAIRIGSVARVAPSAEGGRTASEVNEHLKPGGPDSSTLFDRFWQSTPLCQGGTRNVSACSETIDFSDMPIPTPGDPHAPADLPPPNVMTATLGSTDAEAAMTSFVCIVKLSATFACAASLDSPPDEAIAVSTIAETTAPVAERHVAPMIGAGLTTIGAALVVLGGGTIAYRRATRRSRRRSRW